MEATIPYLQAFMLLFGALFLGVVFYGMVIEVFSVRKSNYRRMSRAEYNRKMGVENKLKRVK